MGQHRTVIEGTGSHHNGNGSIDADLKARECVSAMQAAGQSIKSATFEVGGYNEAGEFVAGSSEDLLAPAPVAGTEAAQEEGAASDEQADGAEEGAGAPAAE